jgi:hypothetical protein
MIFSESGEMISGGIFYGAEYPAKVSILLADFRQKCRGLRVNFLFVLGFGLLG